MNFKILSVALILSIFLISGCTGEDGNGNGGGNGGVDTTGTGDIQFTLLEWTGFPDTLCADMSSHEEYTGFLADCPGLEGIACDVYIDDQFEKSVLCTDQGMMVVGGLRLTWPDTHKMEVRCGDSYGIANLNHPC